VQAKSQRTYRSRGQAVTIAVIAVITAGVLIGMMLGARHRDVLVFEAVFLVAFLLICARAATAGVAVSERGIRVANVFSTTSLPWGTITRFEIGRSGLFPLVCIVRLSDGGTRRAFGIQERTNSPNGSAAAIVDELNAELSRRTGRADDPRQPRNGA
jgi:PH (Pleckstrin Homology) domain-containing protein